MAGGALADVLAQLGDVGCGDAALVECGEALAGNVASPGVAPIGEPESPPVTESGWRDHSISSSSLPATISSILCLRLVVPLPVTTQGSVQNG